MKKIFILILSVLLLCACSANENLDIAAPSSEQNGFVTESDVNSDGSVSEQRANHTEQIENPVFDSFSGIIMAGDWNKGYLYLDLSSSVLVKVTEGWALNSSDLIIVPIDNKLQYEVGMKITIEFDGVIMESYPAQISKPYEIVLDENDFPTLGELYNFENYHFDTANESDAVSYSFSSNSEDFDKIAQDFLSSVKHLKNLGYHQYFSYSMWMETVATLNNSVITVVVDKAGWLRLNNDMFFIGEDKAAEFICYIRDNGIYQTIHSQQQ